MGAVTFSIDPVLVECLREVLPLATFVETGTFEGETITRMRPYFDEIHSVELSDSHFEAAVERFASYPNVHLHHGDSPEILSRLRPALAEKSVLFWLDAHWCVAASTAGIVPWQNKTTSSAGIPKRSCFRKNSVCSSCVTGLVII